MGKFFELPNEPITDEHRSAYPDIYRAVEWHLRSACDAFFDEPDAEHLTALRRVIAARQRLAVMTYAEFSELFNTVPVPKWMDWLTPDYK